ncbi:lipoprotein-anchoring transpeptidase ErfK/SrfK [Clostridium acetobutylicum]|uniref:Secreted protein containing uncharacterized conserved protein of ErfK family n=1 Tax=Clostridium acetobutylicum (strain ATCC 824 / DSM 792 / JCM 1419 / IAM 19013 / LMG 5710 / NBRC 13948 / NRRL B-527 / VKM B-1787 / 2291 / W) TaxID=272562 RepID=Q97L19_CLOAB|nr:L,D-transpeptidase family protein [Clostridium acetobutylicum]AAK78723.1 Secreted protein containing uncharacterized conserved protein of ErfK family [Clostridium acetobutylicum ATCC 824]ADZ19797.1 Secreted protein containing uncharacterized conserved protein of ErfK family [Clostridium acetobutylicum EA 2018]AEI31411.1 ErfK family protein [Clostridium acetobutylicum DSM 1731]MBC2392632.1 L,D-transpeptidase family protein [Clostridium acetobutylicum]MBC2584460.1 L,D-transpeptidase family pr
MDTTETEKKKSKRNKIIIGAAAAFCILLVIYLGMARYFTNHFYFGSKINDVSVSGKTVDQVKTEMEGKLNNYTLSIKERGGKVENIKAKDINVKYNSQDNYSSFKEKQNPYKWIVSVFKTKDSNMKDEISYDDKLLKQKIDNLACITGSSVIEPKSPSFKYTDKGYEVINEVKGNKINKDALYMKIRKAISNEDSSIDLEKSGVYIEPKYTSNSPKVKETKGLLNKYVASKVTYNLGNHKEDIAGAVINKWLKVDDDLNVTIDEKEEKKYLNGIFSPYNTAGKTRSFATSSGATINVSGGDYGWVIDASKEAQTLNEAIKKGQTIEKQPTYSQTAASHDANDIGNTYVEVDLSKQHLWFYKNGSLVVQGDVVTGNVSENDATPAGVYRLKYKERNATLKGQGYSSPVSYWMPFNGGIGIHDANWRSVFGGEIYKTGGSHGCVNSPYDLAKTVFENIDAGTPVVCYY